MKNKKVTHTTIRNGALFCLHCGGSQPFGTPIAIDVMSAMFRDFNAAHAKCKKTWKPDEPNMNLNEIERVSWWMTNGERGISSETMICVCYNIDPKDMMRGFGYSHPLDADDFRRCWLLVKAVPEIKARFVALSLVSPEWKALVAEWDALTQMFEAKSENFHTHLENILTNAKSQKGTF